MDPKTFDLLMARLDRIEKQNDDQLELMRSHIADDAEVAKTVERHSTYFKLAGSVSGLVASGGLVTYLMAKLGLK